MPAFPVLPGFEIALFLALLLPIAVLSRFIARRENQHFLFAYCTGSIVAAILIAFAKSLTQPGFAENPFLIALGIVASILLWKFLFGPFRANTKTAVLGTFIFWIAVDKLRHQTGSERTATVLALIVALIPAIVWCLLFLRVHRERLGVVLLTFFAGMLSTAPILFYDHIVRSGAELHFFLFRVTPESFMRSSKTFVTHLTGEPGIVSSSIVVTLTSFVLVGIIEEWSKHWVIRKGDRAVFRNIDDVIQLSIVAAIGFAFAENIVNPNYFIDFVENFLINPERPEWGVFFGSVFGRSLITNMVHIVSSGTLGYYYGRAFFSAPILLEDRARGCRRPITSLLHRLLNVGRTTVYRDEMMLKGLLGAIGLHSFFDIIVSIPEFMPKEPGSVGDLLGMSGPMGSLGVVAIPALLYVIGGWFLLMHLLHKKDDVKEFGHQITQDVFVPDSWLGKLDG